MSLEAAGRPAGAVDRHLVVGGDGFVGTALRLELARSNAVFDWTSRRSSTEADHRLDLLNLPLQWIGPDYSVVYIVAATPKFADCERDPLTWRINADGPVAVAKLFANAFKVFISSDAVEYAGNTAYARQKAYAEACLQAVNAAVVRPMRIAPERVFDFAHFLTAVARTRHAGLVRWS